MQENHMTRSIRSLCATACGLLLLAAVPAFAHDDAPPAGASAAIGGPAPAGIRGEIIKNMMDAGDKIIELAGAVPASKWAWRPGKGVRSVGEVYLHVAQGNYFLCTFLGAKPPMPMEELGKLGDTPQTPARTAQMLKDSYAFAAKVIAEVPDTEMAASVDFFGQKMSKEAMMLTIASHSHEHLGQSIAYARMNGVVPPWTAREQAAAAAKKAAEEKAHGHSH
jgi:uncharacterized damage-inducible protein DinB